MIQNIPSHSPIISASAEIFIMLIWAFVLWFVLSWLLKPRQNFIVLDTIPLEDYKRSQIYPTVTSKGAPIDVKNIPIEDISSQEVQDSQSQDKLTLIHGITPKIEKTLKENNIKSYQDIVDADVEGLEEICTAASINSKRYSVTTWPDQARLASKWHWRELEEYQAILQKKK